MSVGASCEVCGLRVTERPWGWVHMNTTAGRRADADHVATPPACRVLGPKAAALPDNTEGR